MNAFVIMLAALALLWQAPAGAATADAELRELRQLEDDLTNLDDDLQVLEETSPARARELQTRADAIRDDVTALERKIRRHQDEGGSGTGVSSTEIRDVQDDIRQLRTDIASSSRRSSAAASGEIVVPQGTELSVRLEESISSADAKPEDTVRGTIERPVRVDGIVAIPAGAEVRGTVHDVQPAERLRRSGKLQLEFDTLRIDGRTLNLRTRIVSLQDEAAGKDTARKTGIGAIIGGVVGGLLKGRTGALIGVLAGGGVVVAQKGEDVDLPEGTILKIRVERLVTIEPR
jgi:hypothetical protein